MKSTLTTALAWLPLETLVSIARDVRGIASSKMRFPGVACDSDKGARGLNDFRARQGVESAPSVRIGRVKLEDLRAMALDELEWLLQHGRREGTRAKMVHEVLSRTDPEPKQIETGDIVVAVQVALGAPERSDAAPQLSTGGIAVHLTGNGHERHE